MVVLVLGLGWLGDSTVMEGWKNGMTEEVDLATCPLEVL